RVLHTDRAAELEGAAIGLGSAVLDMLVVATAADPGDLKPLVADEAVAEPLLAVVHGFPRSEVGANGVVLRAEGWHLEDIDSLLELVVELGDVLWRCLSEG
ncbi:MAG: hypothetical protein GY713_05125, partial [Actinomycetia bacterium]|nr:hypothetical protein [Actinomycetes bacterium]